VFRASSKNHIERNTKPQSIHPLSLIGWNTIYLGFEWSVVPFIFGYDLGAQAAYRDAFFGRPAYGAGSQRIVRKDQMNVFFYFSA
jgi:hypothetical protein